MSEEKITIMITIFYYLFEGGSRQKTSLFFDNASAELRTHVLLEADG